MIKSVAAERNLLIIFAIAAIVLAFGILALVAPFLLPFAGISVVLLLCALNVEVLFSVVLLFAVVSTMPGISTVADSLTVQLLPSVNTDFLGLVRTLLAVLMLVRAVLTVRDSWPLVRQTGLCFIGLFVYAVLSLTWSPRWALGESLRLMVYFALAFGTYITTLHVASTERGNTTVLKKFLWLALIVCVGTLLFFNMLPEMSDRGEQDLDRGARLMGIAASPNTLATYLSIFIALAMSFLLTPGTRGPWRWACKVVLPLAIVPLLFTYSRSGWVGAGLAIFLALALRRKWGWMAAFGLGLAILLFSTSIGERFLGDWQAVLAGADLASARGYQNAHGRLDLVWGQAIRELVTPWTMAWGNGAGSAQAWAYTNTGGGLHSEFLEIFLDFGFLGVGLLLLAFGIILRRVFNLFRTATDPMGKALGLGGLCVFAAMLPCFVWQHVFNGPTSWFLLIVWGLALGAEHWASAKQAAPVRVPSSTPILRYREQLKAARLRQAAKGTQPALTVE